MKKYTPVILVLVLLAGCIPSREIADEKVNAAWYLEDNLWPEAEPSPLGVGENKLPSRWVFQYDKSLIWATVKTVRAIDALDEGKAGDEVVFSIAPEHARLVADELVKFRNSIEHLEEIAEAARENDPEAWADGLADALVEVEKISRVAADDDTEGSADPGAWTTGPIVQMLAGFLNDESNGRLLAEIGRPGKGPVRAVLTQTVLRVGFAVAGKGVGRDVVKDILHDMRTAEDPAELHEILDKSLAEALPPAPPLPPSDDIARMTNRVLQFTPPALRVLEAFVRQWDRMESLAVEFRKLGDEPVVAVTFRVKPGRYAGISGLYPMQPEFRFRRGCRVIVLPEQSTTGARSVLLEPLDEGGAEVRFTGLGWALVRLLAIPIDDAVLRGVRIWTAETNPGYEATTVSLLMQALGGAGDRRRMIVFHDVEEKLRYMRGPVAPGRRQVRKRLSFSYLTPKRIYAYQRDKTESVSAESE